MSLISNSVKAEEPFRTPPSSIRTHGDRVGFLDSKEEELNEVDSIINDENKNKNNNGDVSGNLTMKKSFSEGSDWTPKDQKTKIQIPNCDGDSSPKSFLTNIITGQTDNNNFENENNIFKNNNNDNILVNNLNLNVIESTEQSRLSEKADYTTGATSVSLTPGSLIESFGDMSPCSLAIFLSSWFDPIREKFRQDYLQNLILILCIPKFARNGNTNCLWRSAVMKWKVGMDGEWNETKMKFLSIDPITGDKTFCATIPKIDEVETVENLLFFVFDGDSAEEDRPRREPQGLYSIKGNLTGIFTLRDGEIFVGDSAVFDLGVCVELKCDELRGLDYAPDLHFYQESTGRWECKSMAPVEQKQQGCDLVAKRFVAILPCCRRTEFAIDDTRCTGRWIKSLQGNNFAVKTSGRYIVYPNGDIVAYGPHINPQRMENPHVSNLDDKKNIEEENIDNGGENGKYSSPKPQIFDMI